MYQIRISGTGSYLPSKVVLNDDLPKELQTSDEWIFQRTGIRQRQIANEHENTSFMAAKASGIAIENAVLLPIDINLIVVATTTPNKILPSCATQVQSMLGCKNAFCFDIQAVCAGFLYAYYTAINLMQNDKTIRNALIIGSEEMSKILDWNDRTTCILFGDGAGAVVLSHHDSINSGYVAGLLQSNGDLGDILTAEKGHFLKMEGRKVFATAVTELENIIRRLCIENHINLNDIQYFLIHQANMRIIQQIAINLSVDEKKLLTSIDVHANTSAASIPLLIHHHRQIFKPGDLIIMAAIGAGMTWGAVLIRW